MKNVIYRIRNVLNQHYYVGSTVDSRKRFWAHRKALRSGTHDCVRLQRAWQKYGEDCFVFEVLEVLSLREELYPAEQKYLDEHFGADYLYNVAAHADSPMREASPAMREYLAQKTREYAAKNGAVRLGCTHTEDAKERIRQAKLANPTRAWLGKERSDETKAKISAAQKGRANPRKGLPMSEQGRANIAAAAKRGTESHFYGKRPANADDLQKAVYVLKPNGTRETYPSLSYMRDNLGVSVATIIRACKSGKPVQTGTASGWRMSYEPIEVATLPAEYADLPRTRQLAKEQGAKYYFTGEPCTHGHVAPRKVKGACIECAKIEGQKANERARQKKLLPWLTYARDGATAKFAVVHTDAKETQWSEFPGMLKLLRIDAGVWHIETEVHWIPEDVEMAIVELIRGKAADAYWKAAQAFFPPQTIKALRMLAATHANCHNPLSPGFL